MECVESRLKLRSNRSFPFSHSQRLHAGCMLSLVWLGVGEYPTHDVTKSTSDQLTWMKPSDEYWCEADFAHQQRHPLPGGQFWWQLNWMFTDQGSLKLGSTVEHGCFFPSRKKKSTTWGSTTDSVAGLGLLLTLTLNPPANECPTEQAVRFPFGFPLKRPNKEVPTPEDTLNIWGFLLASL